MNDPTSDPRDELASAHLDGATTPEEAARVAADPELARRLAAFEAVRAEIRARVDPDPAAREATIAAALAAFDDEADAAGLGGGAVVAMSAARRGRLRWARAVGVAAAAVLVAALVPMLLDGDDDPDITAADRETAQSLADERAGGGAAGQDQPTSAFDAESGAPGIDDDRTAAALEEGVPELGPHEDLAALTDAVRQRLSPEGQLPMESVSAPTAEASTCLARTMEALTADPDTAVVYQATAVLDGTPVVLVVGADGEGRQTVVVATASGCQPIAREPL